jgi:digeranylgeranylglycerophospholipid reductase
MEKEYDVLVVGGCSAGLYFAAAMARQGYRTLLIEKDGAEAYGRRYDIFHLGKETFRRFGVEEPMPGDPDFVRTFTRIVSRSALDQYPKNATTEVFVLHRPAYMKRLEVWAKKQGVTVEHEAKFVSPVFDGKGRLSGAEVEHAGEVSRISCRLMADASGTDSAVRTALPDGYGVENFEIGPRDKFYVVLYYAKLDNPEKDRVNETCSWPYYKTWKAPQDDPDGAILGVGANLSYEYAKACFERFAGRVHLPPHRVTRVEQGCTPYRRPPYSFVADGFVALGDAACLTNPWTGEGTSAAWVQAEIAAEEAGRAMKDCAYPTREALWQVNPRYYKAQGAEFAKNLSMLAGAVDCTPEENDYEFSKSIIFLDETEKDEGGLTGKVLKGVLTGKLRFATLLNLAGAGKTGNRIFGHYSGFPADPAGFPEWAKAADALWSKTRSMADEAERDFKKMNIGEKGAAL